MITKFSDCDATQHHKTLNTNQNWFNFYAGTLFTIKNLTVSSCSISQFKAQVYLSQKWAIAFPEM